MFEGLVESGSHKEDLARKSSFFFGTLAIYAVIFISLFVLSIYLYNADLDSQNLELVTLVAPVPVQQQEQQKPESKPSTPEKTLATRTELIASNLDPTKVPEKAQSVASKVPPVPKGVAFRLGSSNTEGSMPGGFGTGTGGGGPVVEGSGEAPPPPPVPKPTPTPQKKTVISGGVLNGKAISKPVPQYPTIAKTARQQGTVVVQVLVDEEGKVVSASAVSGPPLLLQTAVAAARQARFSPTMLSGQPVKVSGIITYNFVLQ